MSPTSRLSRKPTEAHSFPIRVYYEDTDAGGIVYHANYLKFAERGRTEYLRALGWDHQRVADELKIYLIVRHAEIDYRAPARLDDLLEIRTEVTTVGNTSLTMKQTVLKGEQVMANMKIVVVAITPAARPVRLPPQLRQIFSG
jgi:acyl-CoA thioester hydrolase